jgi:transcriptional regulator with XRE-family HTH domain
MTEAVNMMTGSATAPAAADDLLAVVSARVRARRIEHRLSLDKLAARSGVSKGMLVQIENGHANPSIATLCKVAAALGASVADLVDVAGTSRADVLPARAPRQLWIGPRGGAATLLVGSTGPDMLELWSWELRPGERYDAVAHPEGTQELLNVTHGRLTLSFGAMSYAIGTGESAVAYTDRPHAYVCLGARPVRFTMVVWEPHATRPAPARRSALKPRGTMA